MNAGIITGLKKVNSQIVVMLGMKPLRNEEQGRE